MKHNKEKIFFTSDHHFSHSNIVKYQMRPFLNDYEREVMENSKKFDASDDDKDQARRLKISKETIERHDNALIEKWNAKVPKDGIVYHLGDFCMDRHKIEKILKQLNGHIFLIKGNHDKKDLLVETKNYFHWIKDYYEIKVNDSDASRGKQNIILCHYAFRVWNKSHYGSWHLYGHSHGSLPDDPNSLSIDVGVDVHNYEPISYEEVKQFMNNKKYKPIDHHIGK